MSRRTGRSLLVIALFAVAIPVTACQVPVFRYALERWDADLYRVTVLHDGRMKPDQLKALDTLRKLSEGRAGKSAVLTLRVIDASSDEARRQLRADELRSWKRRTPAEGPLMLVNYPVANGVGRGAAMFTAPLSVSAVNGLIDSPFRRKLADRLGQGDSAVWIFVPCGREEEDQAAMQRLEQQLTADAAWLELPSAEELEVEPEILEQVKVPLQIRFSTLTLRRDNPAEKFLLDSLIHSEDDLADFDEPLAFPVFGRGRVLYALVGKGIARDTIRAASSFMAGPCSCQVKNENPGFDLLLRTDWNKRLGDVLISEPIESVDTEALAPKLLTIPPGRKSLNGGKGSR